MSSNDAKIDPKGVEFSWYILESNWSQDKVRQQLGNQDEILKDEINPAEEMWIYNYKNDKTSMWSFDFNANKLAQSVTYYPSGDLTSDFSLEKIQQRWSKLKCEPKNKQTLYPDFIKNVTYLSCDNEKRYIQYNRYKEVFFITVHK